MTDDGKRRAVGGQGQRAVGIELLIERRNFLARRRVAPANSVVEDDQPTAVSRENQARRSDIGANRLPLLGSGGTINDVDRVACDQCDQASVRRERADKRAGTVGQGATAGRILLVRIQVKTPHLAVVVEREELARGR
jgi:hypothetical protein